MSDTSTATEPQKLHIWQQNVNRSLEGQLDLLHSLKASEFDIAAIQEPHMDFLGRTRANLHWTVIYPKDHLKNPKKMRSIILINLNISTNNWDEINLPSYDVTGVHLHGQFRVICIINVYNDCKNNRSLRVVEEFMRGGEERRREGPEGREKVIWLGDFNRHHPVWDEERNTHLFTKVALEAAQPLLNMISKHNM